MLGVHHNSQVKGLDSESEQSISQCVDMSDELANYAL
jgi:hypothetical protein